MTEISEFVKQYGLVAAMLLITLWMTYVSRASTSKAISTNAELASTQSSRLNSVEGERAKLLAERGDLNTRIAWMESEIARLAKESAEIKVLREQVAALQKELFALKTELVKSEAANGVLKDDNERLRGQVKAMENRILDMTHELQQVKERQKRATQDIAALRPGDLLPKSYEADTLDVPDTSNTPISVNVIVEDKPK